MPSTVGKSYLKEPYDDNLMSETEEKVGKTYIDMNPQDTAAIQTILYPNIRKDGAEKPQPPPTYIHRPPPPPTIIEKEIARPQQPFNWSTLPDPSDENIVDYVAISYKIANILRNNDPVAYKQCSNFYRNDNTIYILIIIFLFICCIYFFRMNQNKDI
tara:strand:+ start:851 stop:1324 length:474 start_codon:yes stop_codon:yes gene_type:complete